MTKSVLPKSEKKKGKAGRLVFRLILMVLLSLFIGTSVYSLNAKRLLHNAMPMPFGIGSSIVLSGSMEPTLSVNDLVIVRAQPEYEAGEIVVYQSGYSLIIHRIIEVGEDYYVTQGDANNVEDAPIQKSAVKGSLIATIPYVGVAVRFLQSAPGAILVIALAILLINASWKKEREEDDKGLDELKAEIRRLKELEEQRQADGEQAGEKKPEPGEPGKDASEEDSPEIEPASKFKPEENATHAPEGEEDIESVYLSTSKGDTEG